MRRRNMHKTNDGAENVTVMSEAFKEAEAKKRGVCPKCERHIGRGVHFHVRACKG